MAVYPSTISAGPQFGVFFKCDQRALCCLLQITGKDVKQVMFQDKPLCYPTCHRCPGRVQLINYYPLSPSTQPVNFLYSSPSIWYLLGYENVVGDGVESFAEVKVNGINCSPLVHKPSYFNIDGHQVGQI